jgi:hypothetical protein
MIVKKLSLPFLLACACAACGPKQDTIAEAGVTPASGTTVVVKNDSPEAPAAGTPAPAKEPAKTPEKVLTPEEQKQKEGERMIKEITQQAEQKKIDVTIPPPRASGWQKTNTRLPDLAKKVATSVSGMKDTYGEFTTNVETPEGTGFFEGKLKVQDNRTYFVDFVVIAAKPFSGTLAADGQQRVFRIDENISQPQSVTAPLPISKTDPRVMIQVWPEDFSRLAFQGLTEGRDAWEPVLNGLAKGLGGYKTTLEERKVTTGGKEYVSYRVLANRAADASKKVGASNLEIIIDAKRYLPVTIRAVGKDEKGGNWKVQWSARYRFGQRFEPQEFTLGTMRSASL